MHEGNHMGIMTTLKKPIAERPSPLPPHVQPSLVYTGEGVVVCGVREVRQCAGKYYSWGRFFLGDAPVGRMYTVSARLTRHAFCKRQRS